MSKLILFPIFIKHEDETLESFKSYGDIEKAFEYFSFDEEKCEVFDSSGQKLILNVFLHEVKELYPLDEL
jgi:hypothetical protein